MLSIRVRVRQLPIIFNRPQSLVSCIPVSCITTFANVVMFYLHSFVCESVCLLVKFWENYWINSDEIFRIGLKFSENS